MKTIPFDIEKAKAGANVFTHNGEPVRIICYDRKTDSGMPIVALIRVGTDKEIISYYDKNGRNNGSVLRLQAESTYREWKPEEVPVGRALYRQKTWHPGERALIVQAFLNERIRLGGYDRDVTFTAHEMLRNGECSYDWGKTWQPCGVEE